MPDPARRGRRARALLLGTALLGLAAACAPAGRGAAPSAPATAAPAVASSAAPAPPAPAAPNPAATAGTAPGAPAALEPVKAGTLGLVLTNAGIALAAARGYFEQQGLAAELVPFDGGPRMVPALATNEIQVGAGSPGAGLFNALQRGIRSKVVADKASGPPGAVSSALMVRKDLAESGALTRLEDLQGKTFGLVNFDSSQEYTLVRHLALVGLTLADVHAVEMPIADQPAAFANRTLDAAWVIEPGATLLADRGLAARLLGAEERHPNQQSSVIMYSEQFAAQRDPATRWMTAYLQGVRDYNDAFVGGVGREEVIAVLQQAGIVTDRALLERSGRVGLNPNGYVNRQHLQELHDYLLGKGSLTQAVPLDDLVDDQFVAGALARLGVYDSPLYRDPVWRR